MDWAPWGYARPALREEEVRAERWQPLTIMGVELVKHRLCFQNAFAVRRKAYGP